MSFFSFLLTSACRFLHLDRVTRPFGFVALGREGSEYGTCVFAQCDTFE
jgi:hypothetical protein